MTAAHGTGLKQAGLDQFDPRAKLLISLCIILALSFLPLGSWVAYGLLYAGILLLALIGGLELGWLLGRSLLALPFLLAALSLPFIVPGPTVFQLPLLGLAVSQPGLIQGASLALRSWIAVQAFILLMGIMAPGDFFWALEALKLPPLLVSIIAFAYRYLQLLAGEAERMASARRARQTRRGRAGPSLAFSLRSAGGFIGSLLLRGLERSERVYGAMLARGYDGSARSTRQFQWHWRDTWALVFCLLALAGLVLAAQRLV